MGMITQQPIPGSANGDHLGQRMNVLNGWVDNPEMCLYGGNSEYSGHPEICSGSNTYCIPIDFLRFRTKFGMTVCCW